MVTTRILMVTSSHIIGKDNLSLFINISYKALLPATLGAGQLAVPA